MDAHFWMDAHGRSFLDGRSWTLVDNRGRSWTIVDDRGRLRNLVLGRSRDGHATVTVTLPIHKKYCMCFYKSTIARFRATDFIYKFKFSFGKEWAWTDKSIARVDYNHGDSEFRLGKFIEHMGFFNFKADFYQENWPNKNIKRSSAYGNLKRSFYLYYLCVVLKL